LTSSKGFSEQAYSALVLWQVDSYIHFGGRWIVTLIYL